MFDQPFNVEALPPLIVIGHQTESEAEVIEFDISPWLEKWPGMVCYVLHTLPGERFSYPATADQTDSTLRWRVNHADTCRPGTGRVEIRGTLTGVRKMSAFAFTQIDATSVDPSGKPPESARPWVDEVLDAAKDANEAVSKMPHIGENGTWMIWNAETHSFVDSGISAGTPLPDGAFRQLVTDGKGIAKWEDRLAWVDSGAPIVFLDSVALTPDPGDPGTFVLESPLSPIPRPESTCGVIYNGVRYDCVVNHLYLDDTNLLFMGNVDDFVSGPANGVISNQEAPFAMVILASPDLSSASGLMLQTNDSTDAVTLSIIGPHDEIHKIDPKFLPGSRPIKIIIAEDGTVSADIGFAEAWSLTDAELQAAIVVEEQGSYMGVPVVWTTGAELVTRLTDKADAPDGAAFGVKWLQIRFSRLMDWEDVGGQSSVTRYINWRPDGTFELDRVKTAALPDMTSSGFSAHAPYYLRHNGDKWVFCTVDTLRNDIGALPGSGGSGGTGIKSIEQTTTSAEDGGENVLTIKMTNDTVSTFSVRNGSKGSPGVGLPGKKGDPGQDGKSITNIYLKSNTIGSGGSSTYFIDIDGVPTYQFTVRHGKDGENGYSPIRGQDYWTEADQAAIQKAVYDALSVVIGIELADRKQIEPKFAETTATCEDTGAVYILPDGFIYAYMAEYDSDHQITYEGREDGYWASDGSVRTVAGAGARRTNVISVTPGDQLAYQGNGASSAYSVMWLDAEQNVVDRQKYSSTAVPTVLTVPDGVAYAWFQSFQYGTPSAGVVFSVRWVKCQDGVIQYRWANTGHAYVEADYEPRIIELEGKVAGLEAVSGTPANDPLYGKNIIYDGDSIANSLAANGYGYPNILAKQVNGTYNSQAAGGARLTSDASRHSVVDNLPNLPKDGDLYCFEGGINDYWGDVPIGNITAGYTDAVDTTTICGAMEAIFRYALNNFDAPVCFVITHKVQQTAITPNANGDTFQDYRDAMLAVCQKYSIPVYDAFATSGLNGWNEVQSAAYLTGNSAGTPDGIHPNAEGYKKFYVPQLMTLFRSMLAGQ